MQNNFVTWLTEEMESRGWNNSELARRAGLVPSAISQVISGTRSPGYELCVKVARAFGIPPETVLRRARLLPPLLVPEAQGNVTIKQLAEIILRLPEDKQRDLLEIALALLRTSAEDTD